MSGREHSIEVSLRRLTRQDRESIATLANNINIWNNVRDLLPHPYTIHDADNFIDIIAGEDPHQTFGITIKNEICGVIGITPQTDVYRKSAEVGYWVGEPYWGRGIASQAVRLITQYGFNELNLERLYASVFAYNQASMKVLEKNGFQKEGIMRKAVFKNGKLCDEHRYAKLKGN